MADGENAAPREEGLMGQQVPQEEKIEPQTPVEIRMELRDSLPGDRAVVGVEQDGMLLWLASRKYVHPKAVEEFTDQVGRLARERSLTQHWPGR